MRVVVSRRRSLLRSRFLLLVLLIVALPAAREEMCLAQMHRQIGFDAAELQRNSGVDHSARAQFDKISRLTFQLKTAVDRDSAKASYGTAFVIRKVGLLATNFHVVQQALSQPDQYAIFLVMDGTSLPARVVAFDAINDLALVAVGHAYQEEVTMARDIPKVGDRIYSLGMPEDLNESVIEGIYNGTIAEGPYRSLLLSSPLNSGMSGGPTLNDKGELIGVNVAIFRSSQNISFSVPASELGKLLQKYDSDHQAGQSGHLNVAELLNDQLHSVSSTLTEEYLKAAGSSRLILDGWETKGLDPSIKCWRSVNSEEKIIWTVNSQTCSVQGNVQLHDDNFGGRYSLQYTTYGIAANVSSMKFFYWLNNKTSSANKDRFWAEEYYTKYSCFQENYRNAHQVTLTVRVCLAKYILFDDVYDAYFHFVTAEEQKKVLTVQGSAIGFRMRDFKALLLSELDGVKKYDVP